MNEIYSAECFGAVSNTHGILLIRTAASCKQSKKRNMGRGIYQKNTAMDGITHTNDYSNRNALCF